ncbi:MAG: TerC family protein [Proteobacteria bacterium]|nr:TerC family protein [Pseudomonadota bacterium]
MLGDPQIWLAFITLSLLEIVLGIDNIIFITILVQRLPAALQQRARIGGLALAMLTRLALLFSLVWLTHLMQPLFTVMGQTVSARDLVLLAGGLFLLGKSVLEIHATIEGPAAAPAVQAAPRGRGGVVGVMVQIALIDIVFSIDSVLTAIGLVRQVAVMAAAIVVAVLVMMWVSGPIGAFIARHPTIKVLALAFLLLIGVALVAEGLHFEIPKGYLYFAMAFAVGVEMLNLRVRGARAVRDSGRPP